MDDYKAAVRSLLDSLPRDPETPKVINWIDLWKEQGEPPKYVLRIIRLWNFWYHGKVLPHDESVIHEDWLKNYNMDYTRMILPKGGVSEGSVRRKWKETVSAVINDQAFPHKWNNWLWFNENKTQVRQVLEQMSKADAEHAFTWEALAMTIALPLFGIIYQPGQVVAYLPFQEKSNFEKEFRLSVSSKEEVKANILAKRGAGLLGNYTEPTQLEGLSNIFLNPGAKTKESRFSGLTRDKEVEGWVPAVLLPDWNTPMERLAEALEQTLELADRLLHPAVDTNSNVRLIWSQEVVGWSVVEASNPTVRKAWNVANQDGKLSLARVFRDLYTSSALWGQDRVSLRSDFFRSSTQLTLPDKAWEIGGVTLGLAAGRERERILRTYLSEVARRELPELPTGLEDLAEQVSRIEADIAQRRREKEAMERHKERLELLNAVPLEGTPTVAKPPSPWRLTVNDLDLEGLPDGVVLIRGSEDRSNNIAPGFFRGTSVEPHPDREEVVHTMDTAGLLTDVEFKTLFRHRLQPAPSLLWPPASDLYGPSGLYRGEGSGFSLHLDASVALALCAFPQARKAADDLFPEGTKFGLGRQRTNAELLYLIAPALNFRSTLVVAGLKHLADILEEESEKPERQQELRWLVQALVIDELRSAPRGRRKLVQDALQLRNVGDALRLDLSTGGGVELAASIRSYANTLARGSFQNLVFNNHDMGFLLPDGPLLLLGAAMSLNVRIHLVIIGFNPQSQRNALRLVVGAYYPPLNFTLNEAAEEKPESIVPTLGSLAPQNGTIGNTFQLRWVPTLQSYRGAISPELIWRARALRSSDVKHMVPPDNVVLLMEPRRSSGFRLLLSQAFSMSGRLTDDQLEAALGLERLPALGSASAANRIFSRPTLFEPEPLLLVPMEEVEEARRVRWATQESLAKLQPTLYNHLQDVWSLRFYLPPMQLATMSGFHLLAWAVSLQSESAYRWIVQNLERNAAMKPLLSGSPVTIAQLSMSLQVFAGVIQDSPEYRKALQQDALEFVKPLPVQVVFQLLVADTVWTGGPDTGHRHWQLRTSTVAPEEGREGVGETYWVYVFYDAMDSRIQERPVLRLLVNDTSVSLTEDSNRDSLFHKHPLLTDCSLTLAASSLSLQLGGPAGGNPSARGRHLFAALAQTLTLPLVRLAAPTLPGPGGAKAGESGATREPLSLSDITAVEKATAELIRNAARLFQTDSDVGREFLHTLGFENYTKEQLAAYATDLLEEAEELESQTDEGRYAINARRTGSPLLYQPQNRLAAYHLAAASAATYDRKGEVRGYGVRLLIFEGHGEARLSLVHTIEPSEELVRIVHEMEAGEEIGDRFEYALCMTQNSEAPQSWQYLPLVSSSQMGRLGLPLNGLEEVVEGTPESPETAERAQNIVETAVVEETQETLPRPPSLSPEETAFFLSPQPRMSASELVEVPEPEVQMGLAQLDFENAIQGGKSEDDELAVLTERVNAIMRSLSTSHLPAPLPMEDVDLGLKQAQEEEEGGIQQRVDDILESFGQLPDPFTPMPETPTPSPTPPPPEVRLPSPPPPSPPTTVPLTPLPPINTEPARVEKLGEAELQENLTEADIERIISATKKHSQYEYENHSDNILFRFRGFDYKSFVLYTLAQSGEAEKDWLARFKEEVHAALMGLAPYRESTLVKDLQGRDQLIDSVWLMHDKSRPASFKPSRAPKQLEDARTMALRLLKGEDPNFPPGSVQQLRFLAKVADMNHKHWMPQLKELEAYLVGEASKIEAMLRGKEFNEELQIMQDVPVPPVRWISLDDEVQGLLVRNRALIQPLLFPKNKSKNPQALWAHLTPSLNGRGWVMTVAPGFSHMAETAKRMRGTKRGAAKVEGIDAIPHIWVPVVQQQGIFMPNKPTSIFMWKTVFGQTKSGPSTTTRAVYVPRPLTVEEQTNLLNPLSGLDVEVSRRSTDLTPEDESLVGNLDRTEITLRRLQRAQRRGVIIPQPPWQGLDTEFGYESLFRTWWRLTSPRPRTLLSPVLLENSPEGGAVFYGPMPVTEQRMLTVLATAVRLVEGELESDIEIRWQPLSAVSIPAHPSSVEWQQVEESLMDRCAIIHLIESLIPSTITNRDALDLALKEGRQGRPEVVEEFEQSFAKASFVVSAANTDAARQYVSALTAQASASLTIREPVPAPEFNLGAKFYMRHTKDTRGFGNKVNQLFQRAGDMFRVFFHLLRELDKPVLLTHDFFRPRNLSGGIDYETDFEGFNSARWLPTLGRRDHFVPTWGAVIPITVEETGEITGYKEYDWFPGEKQLISNSTYVTHTGSSKNYGLYAGQKIEPKQPVLRYSGLSLNPEEIRTQYPGATLASYLVSVEGSEGGMDAKLFGNESRFANGELSRANRHTLGLNSALLYADRLERSPMRAAAGYPGIILLHSYANREAYPGEEVTFYYGDTFDWVHALPRINQRSYFLSNRGSLRTINLIDSAARK